MLSCDNLFFFHNYPIEFETKRSYKTFNKRISKYKTTSNFTNGSCTTTKPRRHAFLDILIADLTLGWPFKNHHRQNDKSKASSNCSNYLTNLFQSVYREIACATGFRKRFLQLLKRNRCYSLDR